MASAIKALIIALVCLSSSVLINAQGYPFVCNNTPPCEDDPTFLALGAFPCDSDVIDVCTTDPQGEAACQLSCASCEICDEPPAVEGIQVVIQAVPLTDNKVSLWFKASFPVAGAQFDNICTVNGESAFVNVQTNGSGGGASAAVDMDVTAGIEGKWLIFSLTGGNVEPGYYHFTTLLLTQGLSEIGCDEGSFRLTKGVLSDPVGVAMTFCGTLEEPCPGSGGPGAPPVELPPSPPILVEPTTGYPFVCGPAPPCEDDPTFQSLGSFPCGTTSPNICDIDADLAGPACGLSCATCEICEEPPAVDGAEVVIQAVPVTDNKVSLWFKASMAVAGAQFDNICSVNGESAFVDVQTNGSGGGASAAADMDVTGGIEGKWLIFSLTGGSVEPGYYHFTTLLLTQGLSEIGCDEGSFRLTKGVISDPMAMAVTFCGTLEQPCPGSGTVPSPPSDTNFPFPCIPLPCMDDLEFSGIADLPCGTTTLDLCTIDSNAPDACQLSCGTCQPCVEPPPIDDFQVVIQAVPLTDTTVSIWFSSKSTVAGAQFQNECAGVDQVTFIDAISGFGGEADVNNLLVSAGIEGKWLTFSLTGGNIQPGYYHLTTLNIESLQSKGCLPENFVLTKGVVADELAISISFCGTAEQPCPQVALSPLSPPSPPLPPSPPPPLPSPSPPAQPPSPPSPPAPPVAYPFPCVELPPCQDDPTFLSLGTFPCGTTEPDICFTDTENTLDACLLSCGSCPICESPDPIPGIDIIIQTIAITDNTVSIWFSSGVEVESIETSLVCTKVGGAQEVITPLDGFGGVTVSAGAQVSTTPAGVPSFIVFSPALNGPLAAGYYHLVSIQTESLSELNCIPGTVGINNPTIKKPDTNSKPTACGAVDQICPGFEPPPSPPPSPPFIDTSVPPFECDAPPDCTDSTTFQSLGAFPCGTTSPNICEIDQTNAEEFCPVTCSACPICAEPSPISGIQAIVHTSALEDQLVSIWISSFFPVAGVQGRLACLVDDEVTLVDVDGGFGGQAQQFGMDVQVGTFQGLFLLFSLQGLSIPAGYFHLTTLQTASLEEAGCQPGTAGLVEVVISDPLGVSLVFCGPWDKSCAAVEPSTAPFPPLPPSPSPPPPIQPSPPPAPPTPPAPPPAYPFPCDPVDPCTDDSNFSTLGGFACTEPSVNVCTFDENALSSCGLTCGTCEICEEPDDFTGIDVVVQAVALTDTTVSVWFSSSVNVQAAEFASTCLSDGETVTLNVIEGFGGESAASGNSVTGLSNGLWISISLSGFFVPPGYYHYTTLTIESLKEKNCDIGTFAFEFGKILNEQSDPQNICGTRQQPCPGFATIPLPPMPLSPPAVAPGTCPDSIPGSGQVAAPFDVLDVTDIDTIVDFLIEAYEFPELFVQADGTLGCLGIIADGNGDGVVDVLDSGGFYQLLVGAVCPTGFSPAAGGPCAAAVAPPPASCDGLFRNGDVDFDGSLTVEDIEDISGYIVEEIEFTACQIFVADAIPNGIVTISDLDGFIKLVLDGSFCPDGFTSDLATLENGVGDVCADAPAPP